MKNIVASATGISAIYYDLDAHLLRVEYRDQGGSIEEHSTLPEFKDFVRIVENLVEDTGAPEGTSGPQDTAIGAAALGDPFAHMKSDGDDKLTSSTSDEIDRVLFAASRRSRSHI